MSIFDVPDLKFRTPVELYDFVTISTRPEEKLPEDIDRLRRDSAAAYHKYMEAATNGAGITVVAALKEHWERFNTAIDNQIKRAQAAIVRAALEKRLLGFGCHGLTAIAPQIIKPQLWGFLELDFDRAIARAEGIMIHGIKFAAPSENPKKFNWAMLHLLEPRAPAPASRPRRGRPQAHDWGDGFVKAVRDHRRANPEANISSTAEALLKVRYWPPPEPDDRTVRRQVGKIWDATTP